MGRKTVIALLLLILVGLPIVTGYAPIPSKILGGSLEDFASGVIKIWAEILEDIKETFQH